MNAVPAKRCTRCGGEFPIDQFRANPRYAGGRVNWCTSCARAYRAEHYQRNRDRVRAQNAEWHATHKEQRNAAMRAAYAADPETHSRRVRAAKERRPDHYRDLNRENARRRRAESEAVRLRARISSQLRYCLGTGKGGATTERLLGYSIAELRTHIERQFLPGMSWENMGDWHIDHIVPLASFEISGPDDPNLRRAWALPNLRPLWAADNLAKSDKRVTLL